MKINKKFLNYFFIFTLKIFSNEKIVDQKELFSLSNNWKDSQLPINQRNNIVNLQLNNLKNNIIDEVFKALIDSLQFIHLKKFSFLDAACATGYYYEVLKKLESRMNYYEGSDYSESMINEAKKYYPNVLFRIQDLTNLKYEDNFFDVVMLAGVLEHIPNYEKAIFEACRVAKYYVILHRIPLSLEEKNKYTIGPQYNIQTPKIYFGNEIIENKMKILNYDLICCINIYKERNDVKTMVFKKK